MDCPVCDKPMIVLEVSQVEVDQCIHCKGIWLDAGELELLLDGAGNRDELLSSAVAGAPGDEALRRCPICRKKMQKVCYESDGGERVVVDRCTGNDGLWFDKGELTGVVNMCEFPGGEKVFELLNDVFGSSE